MKPARLVLDFPPRHTREDVMIGNRLRGAMVGAVVAPAVAAMSGTSSAQTQLKVMVFPGFTNLPLFAAQSQGAFAKHGLSVEILNTPNSEVIRDGLAKGNHQI